MIRPEMNGVLAVPKRQLCGSAPAKCAPTEKSCTLYSTHGPRTQSAGPCSPRPRHADRARAQRGQVAGGRGATHLLLLAHLRAHARCADEPARPPAAVGFQPLGVRGTAAVARLLCEKSAGLAREACSPRSSRTAPRTRCAASCPGASSQSMTHASASASAGCTATAGGRRREGERRESRRSAAATMRARSSSGFRA
jgi:hypothetical protein